MSHYVYVLRDTSRGGEPFYVGKGSGERWKAHFTNHTGTNVHVKARVRKLTRAQVQVDIVPVPNATAGFALEEDFVLLLGRADLSLGPLLNLSSGGRSPCRGTIRSAETRAKMSAAKMGRSHPCSDETRARMSASHMGHKGHCQPQARFSCLHCRKETSVNNIYRHGIDRCFNQHGDVQAKNLSVAG